ncbi:MAG TPA: hypothetical protein VM283_01305 [Armatimonadota bacterium]|nr:hypothetical protein [Armatimonadota bacterium]
MQPQPSGTNRDKLFFCYFMDCQTPGKPGGARDQTWEVAEQAVRGIAELFAERGLIHALGMCSEPEVALRQPTMFREIAQAGAWQALHFQVRGYRPRGASEDYDWQRPLTDYGYEEQRQVISIAKDEWEQALGTPAEDFGACCAQANDYTFPILAELGFRQSYCSAPGRYNPAAGQSWWGAFPHSHHAASRSRLVCGELELYEFTLTRSLQPRPGDAGVWYVEDPRAEREMDFDATMAIAEASVRDMMMRDHPILYVHVPTHNTWDVDDRSSPRRRAVETAIEVAHALAERLRLQLVPASMRDMHEEADRLNAY